MSIMERKEMEGNGFSLLISTFTILAPILKRKTINYYNNLSSANSSSEDGPSPK